MKEAKIDFTRFGTRSYRTRTKRNKPKNTQDTHCTISAIEHEHESKDGDDDAEEEEAETPWKNEHVSRQADVTTRSQRL